MYLVSCKCQMRTQLRARQQEGCSRSVGRSQVAIAETILTSDCSQSCTFLGPGGFQFHPFTCPFSHICSLHDGSHTCIAHLGHCTLSPATRFVTCDGVTGATLATGICVAASVCDPRDPVWFQLLGDVKDLGDQLAVVAFHLFTRHGLITVQRNRKVWLTEFLGPLAITETHTTLRITPGFLVEPGAAGAAVEVTRPRSVASVAAATVPPATTCKGLTVTSSV
ncbi:IgGFc-binding protein-like isoform X1 [Pyrgilauda ruficollis]|uniref:IgGFc-binding protein-like isoform X1 n=1 Tax=Pyrgilauda ruficollis TaxID=221976 RepID=UPI001B868DED|nr:IgGFc-binding protein-like isoform X1 [Pyrgilauda ruficollis]XP_041334539.1 IgGFc-binding protein-like isoform X1 [Pyrgilauda ruficollis]XP_041334540.1 IgGFc-binding protein-like isoform X1 [Pyrgilauda ruficollis]XP_041334541.1 IgGFc-binding protein-like isoform X1 [Pyrgilauda ruficollis]